MKQSLYEILRVNPDANAEEIRYAAQRLVYQYNPKRHPNDANVLAYFRQIQRAYRILNNATTRAAYDAKLNEIVVPHQPKIMPSPIAESSPAKASTISNIFTPREKILPPPEPAKIEHIAPTLVKENTLYRAHLHWFVLMPSLLITWINAHLLFMNPELFNFLLNKHSFLAAHPEAVSLGLHIFLGYGVLSLLYNCSNLLTTQLILTDRRVLFKTGLLLCKQQEFNYSLFEKILVRQSIFGVAFGFGKVYLQAFGGIKIKLYYVAAPHKFEKILILSIRTHAYKSLG